MANYVTKELIEYRSLNFSTVIPKGTKCVPATNLQDKTKFWAGKWEGMSEFDISWMRNYGFLLNSDEVDLEMTEKKSYACPKCGSVWVHVKATVDHLLGHDEDGGDDETGDRFYEFDTISWGNSSPATCSDCGYTATPPEFEVKT